MADTQISFLGDISLNGVYNYFYSKGINPFNELEPILNESNFVVGNLECLSAGVRGENQLKRPRLKTNLETLNFLKTLNLDLALLANNHVYDNLEDGFSKTINFLSESNIAFIGAGYTKEEAAKPFQKTIGDKQFCILNYVTKDTNPNIPKEANFFVNWFDEKVVLSEIKSYSLKNDIVIVCLHWGGRCEGSYQPDWSQPKIAKKLIDAGASVILGCHSHTFQPYESYKGHHIFYSLGNFCFSDIEFDGRVIEIEKGKRTESMIVTAKTSNGKFDFNFTPFDFTAGYSVINRQVSNRIRLRNLIFRFVFTNVIFWKLYYIKFKYLDSFIFFLFGNNRNPISQIKKLNFEKIVRFLR